MWAADLLRTTCRHAEISLVGLQRVPSLHIMPSRSKRIGHSRARRSSWVKAANGDALIWGGGWGGWQAVSIECPTNHTSDINFNMIQIIK